MITFAYSAYYVGLAIILIILPTIKASRLSGSIFIAAISLIFISIVGENGADLPVYINFFENVTLENPFFSGVQLEPVLGLITASIKKITGYTNGYDILYIYRIFIYRYSNTSLLTNKGKTLRQPVAAEKFYCLFTHIRYGAASIISNGLSFQLVYLFILIETRAIIAKEPNNDHKERRISFATSGNTIILLLAAGSHGIGLILVLVYFLSRFGIWIIKNTKQLNLKIIFSDKLRINSYMMSAIALSIVLAIMINRVLTSKMDDSTSLLLSIITLMIGVITNRLLNRFTLNYSRGGKHVSIIGISSSAVDYLDRSRVFLAVLCILQLVIAMLGGGDAAERITFSTIGIQSLYLITIGALESDFKISYEEQTINTTTNKQTNTYLTFCQ